jgi:hypothetical protein
MNDDELLLSVLRKVIADPHTYVGGYKPVKGSPSVTIDGGAVLTPDEDAALTREFNRLRGQKS